ncbi:glycosyltransferase family 2 protein [Salisaeta longa]|uniref:glycosyltransferase family 2 protein n=1 Tax=Salisaeta longa TaxID=503170 RepID=UPI0003B77FD6|nr:glycosyltransferase family 2 protein [Salisaeta longa]
MVTAPPTCTVTLALCTRNNANSLQATLGSLAACTLPTGWTGELLLVDNGSSDDTQAMMRAFRHPVLSVRIVEEPRAGLSRARNAALHAARGHVILFTDDDVHVPAQWIEHMSRPILYGDADAVAGAVHLAPHLRRPWMTPLNTRVLAATQNFTSDRYPRLVGANMALRHDVTADVPAFDPELGPGALGFEEEVLFSDQLRAAGRRIVAAADVSVEHHFRPDRLLHSSFATTLQRMGESAGYVAHHWHHLPAPALSTWAALLRCRLMRAVYRRRRGTATAEGMRAAEQFWMRWYHYHRTRWALRHTPRHYARHGLVKLRGVLPEDPSSANERGTSRGREVLTPHPDEVDAARQPVGA